jgi:hypothetical protein
MRPGVTYTGSMVTSVTRNKSSLNLNSLVTFQKGNTIYILPNQHRITTVKTQKSNLNLVNLRVNLHK